jgi:hypothetical protein
MTSIGLLLLLFFILGNPVSISAAVMRTLKLGALENTTILTTPTGCQSIASLMKDSVCKDSKLTKPLVMCRIHGVAILSRIGEEHLLAFKKDQSETRMTLGSSEVRNIAYQMKITQIATDKPTCIKIETIDESLSLEN